MERSSAQVERLSRCKFSMLVIFRLAALRAAILSHATTPAISWSLSSTFARTGQLLSAAATALGAAATAARARRNKFYG